MWKIGYLPSCGCVNNTVWLHHMDANKTHRAKAREGLHKNAARHLEQTLEATAETTAVQPLTSHLKTIPLRQARHVGHCWRGKEELISDVLLWTSSHGLASVGRAARNCLSQLCEDVGCSWEDLLGAMYDRDGWREREGERETERETVREIHTVFATWYTYIYKENDREMSLIWKPDMNLL